MFGKKKSAPRRANNVLCKARDAGVRGIIGLSAARVILTQRIRQFFARRLRCHPFIMQWAFSKLALSFTVFRPFPWRCSRHAASYSWDLASSRSRSDNEASSPRFYVTVAKGACNHSTGSKSCSSLTGARGLSAQQRCFWVEVLITKSLGPSKYLSYIFFLKNSDRDFLHDLM